MTDLERARKMAIIMRSDGPNTMEGPKAIVALDDEVQSLKAQLADKDRYANELKPALEISQKTCNEKDARIAMLVEALKTVEEISDNKNGYFGQVIEVSEEALQATAADVAKWARRGDLERC